MNNNGCCSKDQSCSTDKKGCCWTTLIKGAIVGGVVLFAWCWVSWNILPWHKDIFTAFGNEKAVSSFLAKETPNSGIYTLPKVAMGEMTAAKPSAFLVVAKDGIDWAAQAQPTMVKKAVLSLIVGFILTCLLKGIASSGCCCPIMASAKVGFIAALVAYVPNMLWFQFAMYYTLVGMADTIVSLTLAGFLISKLVLKSGSCK